MSQTATFDGEEVSLSLKGLQVIYGRATLRRSMAEQEGDEKEATLAFSEQLLVALFASLMGLPMDQGIIGDAGTDAVASVCQLHVASNTEPASVGNT